MVAAAGRVLGSGGGSTAGAAGSGVGTAAGALAGVSGGTATVSGDGATVASGGALSVAGTVGVWAHATNAATQAATAHSRNKPNPLVHAPAAVYEGE